MGHKLQIGKLSDSTRAVIEYEDGVIVATTVGDIDHEKFANLIVTAANVMPEIIGLLTDIVSEDIPGVQFRVKALLKKLEGADGVNT